MKLLRSFAVLTFVLGLVMLAVAVADYRGRGTAQADPFVAFDLRAAATTTAPEGTPIPQETTAIPPSTPTPSPTPFDGKVMRLKIPALGIDNAVEEIGILPNNELETPKDANNKVGWYNIYKKPGFGENALFSAHVFWNDKEGPFWKLRNAKPGDVIDVVMENGLVYRYSIFLKQQFPRDTIDMGALIWPAERPPGEEWVTLITCGGEIQYYANSRYGEYLSRDVVVAKRIQ